MIKNFEIYERKITRELKPIGDFLYHKFFDDKPEYRYSTVKENQLANVYIVLIEFYKTILGDRRKYSPKDFNLFTEFYDFIEKYGKITCFDLSSRNQITIHFNYDKVEELKQLPEYQEWISRVEPEVKKYLEDMVLKRAARKYNL